MFTTIPTYKALAERYAQEFKNACNTHLNSLNVLDTMEEVSANTQTKQLAGALAVKELSSTVANITPSSIGAATSAQGTLADNITTDIKYIKYVTSLPSSPDANTLYLVKK